MKYVLLTVLTLSLLHIRVRWQIFELCAGLWNVRTENYRIVLQACI